MTSTFKYLRVPADDTASVEELEAPLNSSGGDQLPAMLASAFVGGGAVDEKTAMEEAVRQLGDDEAAGISRERILNATANQEGRTETFALVHPAKTNGYRGVYLYLDEVGKLKNKTANARVLELAERCGFDTTQHSFHGDAFIGAVRTEPQPMRNVDFTENELAPDAPWVVSAPHENRAYAIEMQSFLAAVRSKKVSDEQRRDVMASRGGGGNGDDDEDEEEEEERKVQDEAHGLLSRAGLEEYFASLTDETPVTVRALEGRGNGVVALRDISRFEVLWSEPPTVSMQDPSNMNTTLACAWCHRSIGDIDAQLSLAAGLCDREQATNGNSNGNGREGWADVAKLKLPAMEEAEGIAKIVPCRRRVSRGCQAAYCSVECRSAHARNGHALCCSGGGGGGGGDPGDVKEKGSKSCEAEAESAAADAAAAFLRHCGHHDNLIFMVEIIGRIASALSRGEDWEAATMPFRGFVGVRWWDISSDNDPEMKRRLRGIAARSMELMKQSALWYRTAEEAEASDGENEDEDNDDDVAAVDAAAERATMSKVPDVLQNLGLVGFGHLLGVCDLNQYALKIDVPMRNVARRLLHIDEYDGSEVAAGTLAALLPLALAAQQKRDDEDEAAGRPRWGSAAVDEEEEEEEEEEGEGEEDDDDDDLEEVRLDETADAEDFFDVSRRVFPMFSGQGLFSLMCLCNHSCEPSVVSRFRSWKGATLVRVEALRDISAGEELTLSYIDENDPLEDRKKNLASYGFKCGCPKCVMEEKEEKEEERPVAAGNLAGTFDAEEVD